jgi:hypothetical protein
LAGWWGVACLAAVVIAASFTLLFGWLRGRIHPTVALAVALLAVTLSAGSLIARPHVLALPFLILWTGDLMASLERRSPAPPLRLVLVMILWANLHGSFTIGFVLAGLAAAEAVFSAAKEERVSIASRWGVFLGVIVLAACATPYGYRPMWVAVSLFGSGEPLPYIREWRPLPFDSIGVVARGTLLLLLVGLGLRPVENLFRIVAVALLGYMMLKHELSDPLCRRGADRRGQAAGAALPAAGRLSPGLWRLSHRGAPALGNGRACLGRARGGAS